MRWIKFEDMKPPIGMNIFVTNGRGEVGILQWTKSYNEDICQFVDIQTDNWNCPREIYDLNYWAPIHFVEKYLPHDLQGNLLPKQDWYLKYKDHPNITKINSIVDNLNKKTDDELWAHINGSEAYGYSKVREVCRLIKECSEYPSRDTDKA